MTDKELLDKANAILERLFKLGDGVANAFAFRALLERLHAKDLASVPEAQVRPIVMVRAGILRALIGGTMSLLDRKDWRGNRASIGQLLTDLEDPDMQRILVGSRTAEFAGISTDYNNLIISDIYKRGSHLRNETIAHLLEPELPTPTVEYADTYALLDSATDFVVRLYSSCDRGKPQFLELAGPTTAHADTFWNTHFRGMVQGVT